MQKCFLTYAEAIYELNGSISDVELNASINLLRKRADLPISAMLLFRLID
ncbi:MAG TPA: hypothetical protein VGD22_13340 [Sphingobacteriaceae bacterium]